MSSIARSRFDFPEAFAPKIPAAGRTLSGLPVLFQATCLTTLCSETRVPSIENSNCSRKDRTLAARKERRTEAPRTASGGVMCSLSQESCRNASGVTPHRHSACFSRGAGRVVPGGWRRERRFLGTGASWALLDEARMECRRARSRPGHPRDGGTPDGKASTSGPTDDGSIVEPPPRRDGRSLNQLPGFRASAAGAATCAQSGRGSGAPGWPRAPGPG